MIRGAESNFGGGFKVSLSVSVSLFLKEKRFRRDGFLLPSGADWRTNPWGISLLGEVSGEALGEVLGEVLGEMLIEGLGEGLGEGFGEGFGDGIGEYVVGKSNGE